MGGTSYTYRPVTVKKAFMVLSLFLEGSFWLGTTEVARKLSMPKSTTFGILEDLAREGWVSKDPAEKKYRLGVDLVDLARVISDQAIDPSPPEAPRRRGRPPKQSNTDCIERSRQ